MKLAIMQPYLFPYLGYFQLVNAVDEFVVYDDVNYIKGGWINRNYILSNYEKQLITLPLKGASPNKLINQIELGDSHKILRSIDYSYSKAPEFKFVYPIIKEIFSYSEKNLANFLINQLLIICDYLRLNPKWHTSSLLKKNNELRGQDKVISICQIISASNYINLPGGQALYDQKKFIDAGLDLTFIKPRAISYPQLKEGFVPNLSIIDVMMFNNRQECKTLLESYDYV